MSNKVRVTQRYSAPPERVFDAWLDPGIAGKWLFATASRSMARVNIDARAGGTFRFADLQDGEAVEYTGEYQEIVPPRRLVFTLSMNCQPLDITRVTAEITPLKEGCEVTLTHEMVPVHCRSRAEARWTGILYGLGVTLETNDDRRRKGPIRLGTRRTREVSNADTVERL